MLLYDFEYNKKFEDRVQTCFDEMSNINQTFSENLEQLYSGRGYPKADDVNFVYKEGFYQQDYKKTFGLLLAYSYQHSWERILYIINTDDLEDHFDMNYLINKFSYDWSSMDLLVKLKEYQDENISEELYIYHTNKKEFLKIFN